jgi:hypothetical protein
LPIAGDQLMWLVSIVGAALVTTALLMLVVVRGRADRRGLVRGLAGGLFVAIGLAAVAGTLSALLLFAWSPAWLADAGGAQIGFALGALLGIGYWWLGALVVAVGLLAGADRAWITRGAWLTTPVVALVGISAVGFALGMAQRAAEPTVISWMGTVAVRVEGAAPSPVVLELAAECRASSSGSFSLIAETQEGGLELGFDDDRPRFLAIRVDDRLARSGRGWTVSGETVQPGSGWTRGAGSLTFRGVLPLDLASGELLVDQPWLGTIAWSCPG